MAINPQKAGRMKSLNPAAVAMPQSGIRAILDEASKLEDVLHLEIGQPDLPTPGHIIEAAERAARNGYTGYTPNAGYWSLREAFAARLSDEQGLSVEPEQVVVSVGAMGALFSTLCALVAPGDEILVPDPGYPNYQMPIHLLGAKAVPYPLELSSGYSLVPAIIESLISRRTKAIIINSPSNPTGMVATPEALRGVVQMAQEHRLFVISDEAYDHIVFEGRHVCALHFDTSGGVVSIFSCSKTYSMTGWRVGFSVSTRGIAVLLTKLQEMFVSCAPSVSQKAAEAALAGPQDCVGEMLGHYRRRRDSALELATALNLAVVVPNGAFYMMIGLPEWAGGDSMGFARHLLAETHLAVAPGITFGMNGQGFIRVSLCASEASIAEGLRRLVSCQQPP
jgi:aspartate aminotransferase/aminotransferase